MECSETQEYAKKFSDISVWVSAEIIKLFLNNQIFFKLLNHPFQAFLVTHTFTFEHEKEKTYIFAHMSVKAYRGGGG